MKISKKLTLSQPSGSGKKIAKNEVGVRLPIKLTSLLLDWCKITDNPYRKERNNQSKKFNSKNFKAGPKLKVLRKIN